MGEEIEYRTATPKSYGIKLLPGQGFEIITEHTHIHIETSPEWGKEAHRTLIQIERIGEKVVQIEPALSGGIVRIEVQDIPK